MPEVTLTIHHQAGLHARPLAIFVKTAKEFDADITVKNLTTNKGPANAKSPLSLLLLGAQQGHQILVEATGPEAEEAVSALRALVERDFVRETV
ncbi:MAG: HPr family phosphocarrier protein [Chloroflexi bacterium]|nr:HPr family phosphocarrier protein [Chloroflexota bacterium]